MKRLTYVILAFMLFIAPAFATTAMQIDFLLSGYTHPTTDEPLSDGYVVTYLDGTSTLSALWTDRNKGGTAANPFQLDSAGRAEVYGDNIYKFEIYYGDPSNGGTLIETINGLEYLNSVGDKIGTDVGDLVELIDDGSGNGVFPEAQLRIGTSIGNVVKLIDDGGGNPVFPADVVETDTIKDDAVTLAKMAPGTAGQVIGYDGSGNPAELTNGSMVLLETQTASSDATIDLTTGIDSTYSEYIIRFIRVIPATTSTDLYLRTSSDGGVSFDSGATDYGWADQYHNGNTSPTTSTTGDEADSQIKLTSTTNVSNSKTGVNGSIHIMSPSSTGVEGVQIWGDLVFIDTSSQLRRGTVAGLRKTTSAVDAIQFLFSSGNISSGTFKTYGVR